MTCDSAGATVISIALGSNNLTGTLPALALPDLATLNLEKNHLGGPLPDFSGNPNLSTLKLASNALITRSCRSRTGWAQLICSWPYSLIASATRL